VTSLTSLCRVKRQELGFAVGDIHQPDDGQCCNRLPGGALIALGPAHVLTGPLRLRDDDHVVCNEML
jgi:hypothetical protein